MAGVNKEQLTTSETYPHRLIPSVRDGLVPLQRKILHNLLQQKSRKEIKVDQVARNVSVFSTREPDQSEIQKSIIRLAQDFVGTNNINYLRPDGWFGSRRQGGKDAANGRFIYTQLSDITRCIFLEEDECLLARRLRKGRSGEPRTYFPVLPMILINGYEASGPDWQTSIPPHDPRDVVENLRRRIRGSSKGDMQPMQPWFRNWTGHVESIDQTRYLLKGKMHRTSESVMEVTELPPRIWTQDFESELHGRTSGCHRLIKSYTEHPTTQGVRFELVLSDSDMDAASQRSVEANLGLHKVITTDNMVALDDSGHVQRYASNLDILEEFYLLRLQAYELRKYLQISVMKQDLTKWTDQSRFAKLLLEGDLDISQDRDTLVGELIQHGLSPVESFDDMVSSKKRKRDTDYSPAVPGYEHLFEMTVAFMMPGPMKELETLIASKQAQIAEIEQISVEEMWEADLLAFERAWERKLEYDFQHTPRTCERCGGLGCRR